VEEDKIELVRVIFIKKESRMRPGLQDSKALLGTCDSAFRKSYPPFAIPEKGN
jgi:hypothetical protein